MASDGASVPTNFVTRTTGPLSALDDALRAGGRWVVERSPAARRALLRGRDAYARLHVWTRARLNDLRYDAPIEPYRFLWVDPAAVTYVSEFTEPKFRIAGAVVDGDWDRTDCRFEDLDVFRAYRRHFVEGVPWEETDFFERVVREIERDSRVPWGCDSRRAFEERCARLDDLYEAIRERGYMTQSQLLAAGEADPIKDQNRLKTERLKDEIAICVGRDGELLFEDGRNRLSIAKLLGLDAVPVRVLARHSGWQATRDAYVTGSIEETPALSAHPDLRYLDYGSRA